LLKWFTPPLYAGFFGSWKKKAHSLITFHHTLRFHILSALNIKYLNTVGLSWIFSPRLCLLKNTRAFLSSEKKIERAKFTKSNKNCCTLYFIWQNQTPGPLQGDSHHWSRGSATANCVPFGFLPRRNSLLLMQVSCSVQGFLSRQSSSFSGNVGSSPLTGRRLRMLSKRLSAAED